MDVSQPVESDERADSVSVGNSENSEQQSVGSGNVSSVATSSSDLDVVGGPSEEDRQDPTKRITMEQPIAAAENVMNKAAKKTLPEQPHQPKKFKFPPRSFGQKIVKKRSFQAPWFDRFKWLHYDEEMDAAFCHVCAKAEENGRLSGSARRDAAFLTKGFTNWKDATMCFSRHEASDCHKEAFETMVTLPKTTGDVAEMLSKSHAAEKKDNRQLFMKILENIKFLARQGIALRGDGSGGDSNFLQLLKLWGQDDLRISGWMAKKTDKYTSPDMQNEILQIMALHILREIASEIHKAQFYSIMVDECTDASNKEQLVLCFRYVDADINVHEQFFGLYEVPSISADVLFGAIQDVLVRMNLSINRCRGQCYDGASVMAGKKSGVAKRIQDEEHRALFSHCYGHSLNLAASDSVKGCKLMADALSTTFVISQLIKFSPKREALFHALKNELDSESSSGGIRVLCPTRWTVRGESLQSVVNNYAILQKEWEVCLDSQLMPDVRARIIGVQAQMRKFDFLFGVMLGAMTLKHTDNLSKTMQHKDLSATEAQEVARLTITTLQSVRSDSAFDQFWDRVQQTASEHDVDDPVLPRRRKVPTNLEVGTSSPVYPDSPKDRYRRIYFEALDMLTTCMRDRFQQPGYLMCVTLETLLLQAANGNDYQAEMKKALDFYGSDLDAYRLDGQLQILSQHYKNHSGAVTFEMVKGYLKELSTAQQSFYSEVITVAKLLLVLPATNASSERVFSAMRRIKSYLRATMNQTRLNHLMVLHVHKTYCDNLNLVGIANEFVNNEHRMKLFGKFVVEEHKCN